MPHSLQDTTIHGLYYLAKSKSRNNIIFWSVVTIAGILYASLEIATEVRTTFGTSQFDVQYHTVDKGLERYPVLGVYFSDWTQTVDWRKAEALADELNLTDIEYAIWFGGIYRHNWEFNSSKEEKISLLEKFSSYGNWSSWQDENEFNNSWIEFSDYSEQLVSINSICLPTAQKLFFDVRSIYPESILGTCKNMTFSRHFDFHKQIIHFRLMNYTIDDSSHPKTRYLLQQYPYQRKPLNVKFFIFHSRVREWYTTAIADGVDEYNVEVKPMLTNYPTHELVECKHFLENIKEVGYKCFEWQYSVSVSSSSRYEEGHEVFAANTESAKSNNNTYRNITLNIVFPPQQQWVMQEYKPVFQFYAFVAKIGGTLGLWTGASIVSFVHLVKLLLSKLVGSGDCKSDQVV